MSDSMQINIQTKHTPQGEYMLHCAGRYIDGSLALEVYGEMGKMFKATVCLPSYVPAPRHVMIKDWSENEGVLDALIEAGVIEPPVRKIPINYVVAHECRLTDAAWAIC